MLTRLSQIAASAGAPLAPQHCKPNLFVVVTSEPNALLSGISATSIYSTTAMIMVAQRSGNFWTPSYRYVLGTISRYTTTMVRRLIIWIRPQDWDSKELEKMSMPWHLVFRSTTYGIFRRR
jgi:hypothetical protein